VVLVVCALLPRPAFAQGATATLAGVVRDPQALVVPGVLLRLAGAERAITRVVTTGPDGAYEFPGVLPGEYRLSVELAGFVRQEIAVTLEVNQRVRLDVSLTPSAVSQRVDVTEAVPLLHVSDASVGAVIDQRQVAELPLNGRQFLELALLVPGAPARARRSRSAADAPMPTCTCSTAR
jgi:hypothetical protein